MIVRINLKTLFPIPLTIIPLTYAVPFCVAPSAFVLRIKFRRYFFRKASARAALMAAP
jgi:hypothetical protein